MKCPKCGKEMTHNFCMFCGYMTNGNYIQTKKEKVTELERILGDDYFRFTRMDSHGGLLLLGPLYLCYLNFFFLGFFLGLLDLWVTYRVFVMLYVEVFPEMFPYCLFIFVLYLLLNRTFWMAIVRGIYYLYLRWKMFFQKKASSSQEEYENNLPLLKKVSKKKPALALLLLLALVLYIAYRVHYHGFYWWQ